MIKKIFKYLFIALIVFVVGFLIARIIMSSYKGVFDEPYFDNSASIKTLDLKDKIGERGYFCAYSMFIDEDTGNLEVTIRYNKSAEKYTDTKLENFIFVLSKEVGDRGEKEYYNCEILNTTTKFFERYTYKKLLFNNVFAQGENFEDFDLILNLYSSRSLQGDVDYSNISYLDRQYIHYESQPLEEYK